MHQFRGPSTAIAGILGFVFSLSAFAVDPIVWQSGQLLVGPDGVQVVLPAPHGTLRLTNLRLVQRMETPSRTPPGRRAGRARRAPEPVNTEPRPVWTLSVAGAGGEDAEENDERAGRILVFSSQPAADRPVAGVVTGWLTLGTGGSYLGLVLNGNGVARGSTVRHQGHVFLLYRLARSQDGWRLLPSSEKAAELPRGFFPPRSRTFQGREIGSVPLGPNSSLIVLGDAAAGEMSVIVAHETARGATALAYPLLEQVAQHRPTAGRGRAAARPSLPNLTLLPSDIARGGTFAERGLLTFDREARQLVASDPRAATATASFQIDVEDLIPPGDGEEEVLWFSDPAALERWLPAALRAQPAFRDLRLGDGWTSPSPVPGNSDPAPYRALMAPRFTASVPALPDALAYHIFRNLFDERARAGESAYYVRFPARAGRVVGTWFRHLVMELGRVSPPGGRHGKKHLVFDLQRLTQPELEEIISLLAAEPLRRYCTTHQLELHLLLPREAFSVEPTDFDEAALRAWNEKLRSRALALDPYLGDEIAVSILIEELRRAPQAFARPDRAWVERLLRELRAARVEDPSLRLDRSGRFLALALAHGAAGGGSGESSGSESLVEVYRRLQGGRRPPEFTATQIRQARGLRAHFSALSPSHGAINFVGIDTVLDWLSQRLESWMGYGSRYGDPRLVLTIMGDTGTGKTQLFESLGGYFEDAATDRINLADVRALLAERREQRRRAAAAEAARRGNRPGGGNAAPPAGSEEKELQVELAELIQSKVDALYVGPKRLKFLILDEAHSMPELFPLLQPATGDLDAEGTARLNLNGVITVVILNNQVDTHTYRQLRGLPAGSPGSAALLSDLFVSSVPAESQLTLRALAGRLVANMVLFPSIAESDAEIALLVDILLHSIARKHGATFFFDDSALRFLIERVKALGEAGNYRAAERAVEFALSLCFSDNPFGRTGSREYVIRLAPSGDRLTYREFRPTPDWIAFRLLHALKRMGLTSSRTLTGVLDGIERQAAIAGDGPSGTINRNLALLTRLRLEIERIWPALSAGGQDPRAWIGTLEHLPPIPWPVSIGSAGGGRLHEMLERSAKDLVRAFYRAADYASPLASSATGNVTAQREALLAELLFFLQIARQLTPEIRPGGEFLTSPGTPVRQWEWAQAVIDAGAREATSGYAFSAGDTVHRSARVAAELLRHYLSSAAFAFWKEESSATAGTGGEGAPPSVCDEALLRHLRAAERRAQAAGLDGLPRVGPF